MNIPEVSYLVNNLKLTMKTSTIHYLSTNINEEYIWAIYSFIQEKSENIMKLDYNQVSKFVKDNQIVIAVIDHEVVWMIKYIKHGTPNKHNRQIIEIWSRSVAKSHRKKWIGKLLLKHIQIILSNQYTNPDILVVTKVSNEEMHRYLISLGFEEVSTLPTEFTLFPLWSERKEYHILRSIS